MKSASPDLPVALVNLEPKQLSAAPAEVEAVLVSQLLKATVLVSQLLRATVLVSQLLTAALVVVLKSRPGPACTEGRLLAPWATAEQA